MEANGTPNQAAPRPLLDDDAPDPAARPKHRKSPAVLTYRQSRAADDWIRAHWDTVAVEGLTQQEFADRVRVGAKLPAFTINQLRHLLKEMGYEWPGSRNTAAPVDAAADLEEIKRRIADLAESNGRLDELDRRLESITRVLDELRVGVIESRRAYAQTDRAIQEIRNAARAEAVIVNSQADALADARERLTEIENRLPPGAARIPAADAACADLPG